jgi:hypothetical protein
MNDLKEHIRRLNEIERQKHELKRQDALNKIKQMREEQRKNQNERVTRNVIPQ